MGCHAGQATTVTFLISRRAECASSRRCQRVSAAKLQQSDYLLALHCREAGDEIINRLSGLEMIEQTCTGTLVPQNTGAPACTSGSVEMIVESRMSLIKRT
jgi:hypothetical protein